MLASTRLALSSLTVLFGLAVACSSARKIDVGSECTLNSDCNSPLVCTMGKCHEACRATNDCPAGQSCVMAGGSGVCQLPAEVQCSANVPCGPLLICASDLRCRANCTSAASCSTGQLCVQSVCADQTDVDVNGQLPQRVPSGPDGGGVDADADLPRDFGTSDVPVADTGGIDAGTVPLKDAGGPADRTGGTDDGVSLSKDASAPDSSVAQDTRGTINDTNSAGGSAGSDTQGGGTSTAMVTTFAGTVGLMGSADGTGVAVARFSSPSGVSVDGTGNIFVADTANNTIRKITTTGVVTTLAGTAGLSGGADGTGAAASFSWPSGVAVDGAGNVFVADQYNNTIRKITTTGVVTTLAGTAGLSGSADGTGAAARFNRPSGVAVDGAGNVLVADQYNDTIRKITPAGVVSTLAGTAGLSGSADGTGAAASFSGPIGVAADAAGNVFVADTLNNTIRKITPTGVVTTLVGTAGSYGSADGTGTAARFDEPSGVAVDGAGNVFVADAANNTIRKITPAGVTTTLAGIAGSHGSAGGTGIAASFYAPAGVAVDGAGNVLVADAGNQTIREVTATGVVTMLAGATGLAGSADGTGAAASFNKPQGVAVDGTGNVFVADTDNNTIRKITPTGVVTTFAGTAGSWGSVDGTGAAASFTLADGHHLAAAVAADGVGSVFVADLTSIRKITPSGVVTTLAGIPGSCNILNSCSGIGSTDGTGATARFSFPSGVAVDSTGNLFVADTYNNTIRKITPSGVVTTLAGTAGKLGSADGTGAAAKFSGPVGVAADGAGNVFVADTGNNTIRKITPASVVTTLAGTAGTNGSADGTGAAASFSRPSGVAVDGAGNLFVADTYNHTIRKITGVASDQ